MIITVTCVIDVADLKHYLSILSSLLQRLFELQTQI